MDSDSIKTIFDDGLPELYTSPSKIIRPMQEDSLNLGKVWDSSPTVSKPVNDTMDNSLHMPNIKFSGLCLNSKLENNAKNGTIFDKSKNRQIGGHAYAGTKMIIHKDRKRGETPGSDSPKDFLLNLANLKLGYKLKDDFKGNKGDSSSLMEDGTNNILISQNVNCDDLVWNTNHNLQKDDSRSIDLSHIRAVEGADSISVLPFTPSYNSKGCTDIHIPPSISSSEVELNLLCRNSPAGISTPESLSNNGSTNNDCSISILKDKDAYLRPPVLGQCVDAVFLASSFPSLVTYRKDLGSTDGEDSSNDSIQKTVKNKYQKKIKVLIEPCSIGSQSENTDSTSTVLDMKRLPVQGCENNDYKILTGLTNLSEPNFLVGGPISPCIVDNCKTIVDKTIVNTSADCKENSDFSGMLKISSKNSHLIDFVAEQDDSLPSVVSAESTQHPESSECITPPSITCMSISSIASSKKLEWDSAADVGYDRKSFELKGASFPAESLSTLERIAIGNYAAMMRTEPEGTTNTKGKIKFVNKKILLKQNKHNNIGSHKSIDKEIKSVIVNAGKSNLDYSTSEENIKDSSVTKKIFSHKHLSKKVLDHPRSQGSLLKKKYNSSLEISSSKIELKKCISNDNSNFSYDNIHSDDDGQELKNRFLDLKHFQSSKSTSSVSLPYYCISGICGDKVDAHYHSMKSQSLQMFHFNNESDESCSYKKNAADKTMHCSNNIKEMKSTSDDSQTETVAENNFNSLVKCSDSNSSYKSEVSCAGNSYSSSNHNNGSSLSLNSINNVLGSFSYKLKEYVLSLKNNGSFSNLNDYDKLQDYIEFVGIPSNNDEEVQLKQSVADIIMRMFSDISKSDYPESILSSSLKSFNKEHLSSNTSSLKSDEESFPSKDSRKTCTSELPSSSPCKHDEELNEISNKQPTLRCVPYHPSSASRAYFIVTSEGNQNSSCKGVYQDRHGTFHVAHQPPGYNSNIDSHLSESASDNDASKVSNALENRNFENIDSLGIQPTNDQRRNLSAVLSSTGSESAYETIRERHQNIGEALASSFEFYSTSPRDARVLGYVTSDAEKQEQVVIRDGSRISEASLCPRISDVAGINISSNKSTDKEILSSSDSHHQYVPRKSSKKAHRKARPIRKTKACSSNTETDEASSNVSIVQFQRQRYVRKFKNYIHTLKKLERNLMQASLESFLRSVKPMSEVTELSSDASRTHLQNIIPLSNESIDCSLAVSSVGPSSINKLLDEVENSLIIHRTSSATIMDNTDSSSASKSKISSSNNSINSNLPSSESTPNHTSTLRKEKEKLKQAKIRNPNCVDDYDSKLRSCGKVSDFRKLMSSTSVPGEIRPYRYLLQKKNCLNSDILQNKISDCNAVGNLSSKISGKTKEKGMGNNMDSDKCSDKKLEKVMGLEGGYFSLSCDLTSDKCDKGIFHKTCKVRKNAVQKSSNSIMEATQVVNISKTNEVKIISKETRDFCQMFPSMLNMQTNDDDDYGEKEINKTAQAIGTQTDESEIFAEIFPGAIVCNSLDFTIDHRRKVDVGDNSSKDKDKELNIVTNDQCHISLLDQMEAKIKDNTSKITAALEDYNKQFGSLTSIEMFKRIDEPKVQPLPMQEYATSKCQKNISSKSQIKYQDFPSMKNIQLDNSSNISDAELPKPRESFTTAKNGMKFVVNVGSMLEVKNSHNKSLAEELIELNKKNEIMTLQEALALARPGYIKEAERRRIKICRKQTIRRELQAHNQSVLAQLPDNLKTPTILRKFLYKPDESPLFNYKAMREQNKRLYQMLPEAQKPGMLLKKASKSKAQRLMASYYSQKLRGKVLRGKVSHAHHNIVTPIR